jgi:nitrite reductase (cytochrome c-552)
MKNWILFIVTAVIVFILGMLTYSIMGRKSEAKYAYKPKVEIEGIESRDSVWGLNFPRQYQSYIRTADTTFKGYFTTSGHKDILEEQPDLAMLWAGYGFSKDYNHPKGHFHAVNDVRNTLRTGAPMKAGDGPMPSACWACKSPDVPRLMDEMGVGPFYSKKLSDLGHEVINPIGCADCHDPKTMNLTITRPALVEAFKAMGKDIKKASHQEMRSLVCAQCHVEYYFSKKVPGSEGVPYVVFPWKKGLTVEDMEKYYDEIAFEDWVHPVSKAKMLKAQHPDWEIFTMGVHAKRGVSCADCHMPYKSEGGQKFTDHHIQSPLANVENACFVCHREQKEKLMEDVFDRQKKLKEGSGKLQRLIAMAHVEAGKAWELGAREEEMKDILMGIRHAQWRWDFSVAGHGNAFHAPVEVGRIISSGMDKIGETRLLLARLLAKYNHNKPVPMPDFNSKSAMQKYIGLDMVKERDAKSRFQAEIVPQWIEKGKKREAKQVVKAAGK